MEMHKDKVKMSDGRYLIYYTFEEKHRGNEDVRIEMASDSETMGNNGDTKAE